MQQHEPLPIKGYTTQPETTVSMVNANKELEERLLRMLDVLADAGAADPRWLAIARTNIEQGFMALNRAIFKPQRIKLPGE